MIKLEKTEVGHDFLIGGKTVALSFSDVEKLKTLMDTLYRDGFDPYVSEGSLEPWSVKPAGEYDHPWETRSRSVLYFGELKWHFTESEMEHIYEVLENIYDALPE